MRRSLLFGSAVLSFLVACVPAAPPSVPGATSAPPAAAPAPNLTPTPAGLGAGRSPRRAAIAEPTAAPGVFPRKVIDLNGEVVIPRKPMRIHTLSVGYDEITFRLVDPSRVVAVGSVSANPDFSNIPELASQVPNKVGRNAEQIVALNPDLVVASPFANKDLLKQLQDAKVPLVVADLVSSVDAHTENIRFLAYLYGEEERGAQLVTEVEERIGRLNAVSARRTPAERPRAIVLSGGQTINAAGSGTTEGGILELAGTRNAAAEAGVVGNKAFALESLPDIDPDVVVVAEANPDKPSLLPRLREHPVVGQTRAFKENRVVVIRSSLLTTLSHWNVVGAEQLSRFVYPDDWR